MAGRNKVSEQIAALRRGMLEWYSQCRRDLPWRRTRDPYAIWISEIMLQQTRVAVVAERYGAFLERFPTLKSLARADEQEVLALWSGLGYYRRARMLHQAAQFVAQHCEGNLPAAAEELRTLPGIGAYTAAAIASIAHGECAAVVDGNVERVLCRLKGWDAAGGRAGGALRRRIAALAARLIDPARPGDWNQAMMELGATVCVPRNPRCAACPMAGACKARGEHRTLPRAPMQRREIAHALAVRTSNPARRSNAGAQEILLEQRPAKLTVMPGLWELPALRHSTVPEPELRMTVRHVIMQVNYSVRIRDLREDDVEAMTIRGGKRRWVPVRTAARMALTGLTRKVLSRVRLLPTAPLAAINRPIQPPVSKP